MQPKTIFLSLAVFKGITFFLEKPIYFIYQKQVLNVLRSVTFSVAIYGKIASFSDFGRIQGFSGKPIYFAFEEKPIFECFVKSH